MHGLTTEETDILKLLENYGCLKESQIHKYYNKDKTDLVLGFLYKKGLITRKDGAVALRGLSCNEDIQKAFEVLLHFRDELQDHWPVAYPFVLYFMKNNKPYDVAVVVPGNEAVLSAVINRSFAQRVIAVIENKEQISELEIEKPVLFFIPGNPPKLYEKSQPQE